MGRSMLQQITEEF